MSVTHLQCLDKGVPHLRKTKGELQIAKVKLQRAGGEDPDLIAKVQEYIADLQQIVEARRTILHEAVHYKPRNWKEAGSKTRIALTGDAASARVRERNKPFSKALVMGLYHSCTNAVQQELEKRFDVEVINDWHSGKETTFWKHRVNHTTPNGIPDDCLIMLMVKEPYFWLKSCSRAERNFFEIHPFSENERGERIDVPPKTLQHLFVPLEHDAIIYPNAVGMWNDVIRSYFDESVYPPDQTIIVRSEDFLFHFHEVMDELAGCWLQEKEKGCRPEPLAERAKGHIECRSRDDALSFYGNLANWKSDFSPEELSTVARDIDPEALKRLNYAGPNPVKTWASYFLVGSWNDWKRFVQLEPLKRGDRSCRARVSVRKAPGMEEFQILSGCDWNLRFHPGDGGKILGPDNAHGANWKVDIPAGCSWLQVTWNPQKRTLEWEFLKS